MLRHSLQSQRPQLGHASSKQCEWGLAKGLPNAGKTRQQVREGVAAAAEGSSVAPAPPHRSSHATHSPQSGDDEVSHTDGEEARLACRTLRPGDLRQAQHRTAGPATSQMGHMCSSTVLLRHGNSSHLASQRRRRRLHHPAPPAQQR